MFSVAGSTSDHAGAGVKEKNGPVSSSSSLWSDLPRRLMTISIGFPTLWLLWSNDPLRVVFFQGTHIVIIYEWVQMTGLLWPYNLGFTLSSLTLVNWSTFVRPYIITGSSSTTIRRTEIPLDSRTSPLVLASLLCVVVSAALFTIWTVTNPQSVRRRRTEPSLNNASSSCSATFSAMQQRALKQPPNNNNSLTSCLMGICLITIPFHSWMQVIQMNNGQHQSQTGAPIAFIHTVSLLLTVWNTDTGALLTGRIVRGTTTKSEKVLDNIKSHPAIVWLHRISPGKSFVGIIGGIAIGTLTYWGMSIFWSWVDWFRLVPRVLGTTSTATNIETALYTPLRLPISSTVSFFVPQDVWIGLLLSCCAILGDLWESALKRWYQVKDSGSWLPGHGGILDRFDSSLLAILVYHFLLLLEN